MKLLLDQGLPRSSAILLREKSIDTVHTGEIGCSTMDDESILELARKADRIVVTLDSDFHAILALSKSVSPSVIRIRIEGFTRRVGCGITFIYTFNLRRRLKARSGCNNSTK